MRVLWNTLYIYCVDQHWSDCMTLHFNMHESHQLLPYITLTVLICPAIRSIYIMNRLLFATTCITR